MPRVSQSKGRCYKCKQEFGMVAMKNHVLKCNDLGEGKTRYFLIRVEGFYSKYYWFYLQVKDSATLHELDDFLRDIWLECCGHLSSFTIDDVIYDKVRSDSDFFFGGQNEEMSKYKLKDVLEKDMSFKHEYDFGSTTTLKLIVVDTYKGNSTKEKITLLARNNKAEYKCKACGEEAGYVAVEGDEENFTSLCEECVEDIDEDVFLMTITNSPRMGVCGYEGDNDVYELE